MKYFLISLLLIGTFCYNPQAAYNYAHQWALSRNPAYHDYSNEGGDCANFVSQCLIAGGLPIQGCYGAYGQGGTVPYVPNLESCLSGSMGWHSSSSMPSQGMPVGSVMTYYNGGHAVLVVSGGTDPLVAAHTNDHWMSSGNYGYGRKFFWP